MKIYCNGDIVEKESLGDIFEPGFLFGWGVFEPLRTYGDNIPFLSEHIARLNKGLSLLGIEEVEIEWEKEIRALLSQNNLKDGYVRLTAYKKRGGTGLIIYVDKFGYYPDQIYEKGFSAIISPYKRYIGDISCQVKSLSYLTNRVSWLKAQVAKKNEALILNTDGYLTGGSRGNLFIVKDNKVITPTIDCGAFSGITREAVIKILKDLDIEVKECKVLIEDLSSADEAFITSSLMEVMPLVEAEGKNIGDGKPGNITLKVLSEYRKITRE